MSWCATTDSYTEDGPVFIAASSECTDSIQYFPAARSCSYPPLYCCSCENTAWPPPNDSGMFSLVFSRSYHRTRPTCSIISYWHHNVVCLSVSLSARPSGTLSLWLVTKRYILQQVFYNQWIYRKSLPRTSTAQSSIPYTDPEPSNSSAQNFRSSAIEYLSNSWV